MRIPFLEDGIFILKETQRLSFIDVALHVWSAIPEQRLSQWLKIYILDLIPDLIGLGKYNRKAKWEIFKFGELACLI